MNNRSFHLVILTLIFIFFLPVFSEDRKINDDTGSASQMEPDIAMHPNGPGVVSWSDMRLGNPDIYMQMFNRRGAPNGVNQRVNDDAGSNVQYQPAVDMDAHGGFVIAWTDIRIGSPEIFAQRFAANGRRIGTNRKVNDNTEFAVQAFPAVSMNKRGESVIVWSDTRVSAFPDIYFQQFDVTGEPTGPNGTIHAANDSTQSNADVTLLESGVFMVTWLDRRSGIDRVYARAFDADGAPRQTEFQVSNHPDPAWRCWDPSIAAGPNGTFAIVWEVSYDPHLSDVFGCLFDSTGQQISGQFKLTDSATFQMIRDPVVAAHPVFPLFGVVFRGMKLGKWGIYYQQFAPSVPTFPDLKQITESTGDIQSPALAIMELVNAIFVWSDNRNGNDDIYAAGDCEKLTLRTTVGTGFDHQVPISWEPQYGYTENTRYYIYQIENGVPGMINIGNVNTADLPYPKLMLDFVDTKAENGHDYQYAVRIEGAREDFMIFHAATPSGDGFSLFSNWMNTSPVIDGQIKPDEWDDASILDNIANPDADSPVRLYVKNDGTYLYIAVDDPNDDFVDPANQMGFLFDEDNNDRWEPDFLIGEGAMTLTNTAKTFTPYTGDYPFGFHVEPPRQAGGVEFAASAESGHLQYEAQISLTESPLLAYPGDVIGAAVWVADPGHFYAHGNGNAGEWPLDALWDAASTLGDLILAVPQDTSTANDWPMPDGNAERDNWAHHESVLDVPFAYQETLDLGDSARSVLAYVDPYLYVSYGDTTDSLTLMAYDPVTGMSAWHNRFRFDENWEGFLSGFPMAVGDSALVTRQDNGVTAFDRWTGEFLWKKEGSYFYYGLVGVDEDQFYWENDSLYCLSQKTGETLWQTYDYWFPASDHNRLFTSWKDSIVILNKWSGKEIKRVYGADGEPYFAVDKSCLYTLHRDSLIATRKSDLTRIWAYPMPYESLIGYVGSPRNTFAVDDQVICYLYTPFGENSRLIVLDKATGEFLWEYRFDGWTYVPLTLANGIVYTVQMNDYQSEGILRAFDREDGTKLFTDDSVIYCEQPIVAQGKLFVPYIGGVKIFSNNPIRITNRVDQADLPDRFWLGQNYPNPFNPVTAIPFEIGKKTRVTLKLFDLLGREIATLADAQFDPGHHVVEFESGSLSSGIYFYQIKMGEAVATRKMVLLK